MSFAWNGGVVAVGGFQWGWDEEEEVGGCFFMLKDVIDDLLARAMCCVHGTLLVHCHGKRFP